MTDEPTGIPATLAILATYKGWVVSGEWDAMPAARRRALLVRLIDHMTEFAVAAEQMSVGIAALLATRAAVREAADAAGLVEAFIPADTIGSTEGSA